MSIYDNRYSHLLANNIDHSMGGYRFGCMIYIWQPWYKFGPDGLYSRAAGNNDVFRRRPVKLRKIW